MVVRKLKKIARMDAVLVAAAAIVLLAGIYSVWQVNEAFSTLGSVTLNNSGSIIPQIPGPAKINVTMITVPNCPECYNFTDVFTMLNTSDINLSIEFVAVNSTKANTIVGDYALEKLPALYIVGETNKTATLAETFGTELQGEGFLLESPIAPYYSVNERRIVGRVTITIVKDSSCVECYFVENTSAQAARAGIALKSLSILEYNSSEGRAVISAYNITEVPVLVFDREIEYYSDFAESLASVIPRQSDGSYVLAGLMPYRELNTSRVRGIVEVVYITDPSCETCYNVSEHQRVLASMGMYIANETEYTMNSTEGARLIAKYNITGVPTLLISPEASVYATLGSAWPSVGTVESDGWYVFRNVGIVGVYRNVTTGQIVNATG